MIEDITPIIDFTFAPGMTDEQMLGFEIAGAIWSQYFDDQIQINIYVETVETLSEEVAGGSLPGMFEKDIDKVREYLGNDATSDYDDTAVDTLTGLGKKFDVAVGNNVLEDINDISFTRATGKAMGIIRPYDDALDGYIAMNNNISWSYNYDSDEIASGAVDYLSVAMHEVGHILGVVSAIDNPGFLFQTQEALTDSIKDIVHDFEDQLESALGMDKKEIENYIQTLKMSELQDFFKEVQEITDLDQQDLQKYAHSLKKSEENITMMDLYRYSEASVAQGLSELGFGVDAFFSIDGGQTAIANFSNGEEYQASHWQQQDNPLGIMDPGIVTGMRRDISELDLQLLDVMGFDLNSSLIADDGIVTEDEMEVNLEETVEFVIDNLTSDLDDVFS